MPSVEGLPARRAALQMLDAVLRRGRTLDSAAQGARDLKPADQALAVAITGEVLRRMPDLDALIDSATRQRLPDDSKARMVLRAALAQKVGLGTPEHALVATALPLVDGGPRRLVHGVLGTLLRRGVPPMDSPRLPEAVEQRWGKAWGGDAVASARRLIAKRPPLDLSFIDDAAAKAFAERMGGRSLATNHVRLQNAGAVSELSGFAQGGWWVQDLAASLPARMIPANAGDVLDLCAAPGGKTTYIAQLMQNRGRLVAEDLNRIRLELLRENCVRLGVTCAEYTCNSSIAIPELTAPADRVLVDVPCSNTGVMRRRVDVRWRIRPEEIVRLRSTQLELLNDGALQTKSGGALIYSTCSLEPEENSGVVNEFLASRPEFTLEKERELLPFSDGVDGAYVARLRRRRCP